MLTCLCCFPLCHVYVEKTVSNTITRAAVGQEQGYNVCVTTSISDHYQFYCCRGLDSASRSVSMQWCALFYLVRLIYIHISRVLVGICKSICCAATDLLRQQQWGFQAGAKILYMYSCGQGHMSYYNGLTVSVGGHWAAFWWWNIGSNPKWLQCSCRLA